MTGFRNTTIACRCQSTPRPDWAGPCPCNGTGVLIVREFERTGRSDIPNDLSMDTNNNQEASVKLPEVKTSREGRDPRDARVLLSSPPKIGKTTLLSQWAPDTTLILDTHKGTALLDGEHYVQPIATFADFEQAIDLIAAGAHSFRTIGIDLVEDVWKLADRAAADRNGKLAAGLVEYGKGTAEAEGLFRRAVDKLLASPYGVWFITHVDTIQDGNDVQRVPRLDKRIKTYIEGATDFVLIGEGTPKGRVLHTVPSVRFQAGSRVPLKPMMPLDARELYVEIAKGLGKPKPAQAATAAKTETQQEAVAA